MAIFQQTQITAVKYRTFIQFFFLVVVVVHSIEIKTHIQKQNTSSHPTEIKYHF